MDMTAEFYIFNSIISLFYFQVQQSEKDYGKFYPIPYNEWNSTLSHGFPQKYNDQVCYLFLL